MLVIAFEAVVQVFGGAMLGMRQDGAQGRRVALCRIRRDARRCDATRVNRRLEERLSGSSIAPVAQLHIDNLPVLVDGTDEVVPTRADVDLGLVDPPAPPNHGAMRSGCRDKARCKHAHPVVDGARIDGDAAFGQPLRHFDIAEAIAELPADRERDDVVREAIAAESGGRSCGYATSTGAAPIHLALLTVPPCFDELLAGTPVHCISPSMSRMIEA